jgi:hypothetical protein
LLFLSERTAVKSDYTINILDLISELEGLASKQSTQPIVSLKVCKNCATIPPDTSIGAQLAARPEISCLSKMEIPLSSRKGVTDGIDQN